MRRHELTDEQWQVIELLLPASGTKGRPRVADRPPAFDRTACKRRNIVERCFNRLTQFRAIATRFDKTAISYRGMIDLATLLIWL